MEGSGPICQPIVPRTLYRVGDIVRHTGLSRQTIHNYTIQGLIHAADHTQGGHRLYDESVFYRLREIAERKATESIRQIADSIGSAKMGMMPCG